MKRPAITVAIVALTTLALLFALPAGAEIYKWKDKDGRTHFSDMPPAKGTVTTVSSPAPIPLAPASPPQPATDATGNTGTGEPAGTAADAAASPAPAAAPNKNNAERDLEFRERRTAAAADKAKADKDAAEAARRAENCERARSQHAALVKGQRVVRPTADGGREFLDADDRAAEISRAQEQIDTFCK
jgi:hypothetical protein